MKKFCLFMLSFLFFISFQDVKAIEECTAGELKRLKEIANNVEFTYDYEIVSNAMFADDEYVPKTALYSITSYNLSNEIRVKLIDEDKSISFTSDKPTLNNFLNGEVVRVEISAYTSNLCAGKILKTVTIRLPYFNNYSLKEECSNYKEFKYCQEFGKYNISEEVFYSKLEEYKKEINKEDEKGIIVDDLNDVTFYLIIGVILIIFFIGIIVFLVIKRNKKKESDL